MTRFRLRVAKAVGETIGTYAELHRFSIERPELFWREFWDFAGIIGDSGDQVLRHSPDSPRGGQWFPNARLSFAQNMLRGAPEREALVAYTEDGERESRTIGELRADVARWMQALARTGVRAGSCVAAVITNGREALTAMLATAALGATWTSTSPDFGPDAVLDRFRQVSPDVLIGTSGHRYGGKTFDALERLAEIAAGLPSLEAAVVIPVVGRDAALPSRFASAPTFLEGTSPNLPPIESFAFDHPLYIVYSSGTTGKPKCIVHGAGGVLFQHKKEHLLHCDIRRDDRVFYYSTCGWMMWNWLVSSLASEATVLLYDGSPAHPPHRLLDLAKTERATFFGASARYYDMLRQEGLSPSGNLEDLRTLSSTGSPLSAESFEYMQRTFGSNVHIASISGGTDILSCFVGGDPTAPVHAGEIQVPGLGMDVDVVDETGRPVRSAPGELVCRPPFPGMPLGFHDDPGDLRFRKAYFERFKGLWTHGDLAEWTANGGMIIHGRSDATLNVNGVRIGTAEIYREVERFEEVTSAVAVEVIRDGDSAIALALVLRAGSSLDEALDRRIRKALRERRSPRHVPKFIFQVADLPKTRSGKTSELAVREVLRGRRPANFEALANPECLDGIVASFSRLSSMPPQA